MVENNQGTTAPCIGGTRSLLSDSRRPKMSRCDPGNPFKMQTELALIRETSSYCYFGKAKFLPSAQEFLRSFNSSGNNELVGRQTGGGFKLACEMIRAEMDQLGHSFQCRSVVQVRHDVVDNCGKLSAGQHSTRPSCCSAESEEMTDQVNGQDVGERLHH